MLAWGQSWDWSTKVIQNLNMQLHSEWRHNQS
jgi:hypothetical protein